MFLISGNFAISQTEISGFITDSLKAPIPFANVILKPKDKETLVAFTSSDQNGYYLLKTDKTGDFVLDFISFSYQKQSIPISIETEKPKTIDVKLTYEPMSLNEVLLEYEASIKKRPDTTTFKASTFLKGNEVVVEDLLKNIPGLTVEEDGTIKVGNREVEKVMVDGDDFFEKGYKLLTKNLNAAAIETVEVYERYSNNRLLKGIEESERVALNLTLKEGQKQQWFGNMSLGYGFITENTYSTRTNLMSFGKKAKYYFLGNLNNVGTDATGDINQLIRPSSQNEPGSVGSDENAFSFLSINNSSPLIQRRRLNFNNTELASLNAIFSLSDNMKLKTMGLFNWDENKFFRNSFQEFLISDESFTITENFDMKKSIFTGLGKVDFNFNISENKMIEYVGKFNNTNTTSNANLTFNDSPTLERLKEQNELLDHKINFTNKFTDTQVLLVTARVLNEKTPQYFSNTQFLFEDLFPEANQANRVEQTSKNKMFFAGSEAHYLTRQKSGNLLELRAGQRYRKDKLASTFSYFNDEAEVFPEGFSNNLSYEVLEFYSKLSYLYVYKNLKFSSQIGAHQLFNSLKSPENSKKQTPFYLNPSFGFEWAINNRNKISSRYSKTINNSTLEQIYPNFILTSFRNFSSGTNEFEQLKKSAFFLKYDLGNWNEKFHATTTFGYSKDRDFFSTNSQVRPDFSVSELIKLSGRTTINANTTINRYLNFVSSNLKVNIGVSNSKFKNIVNDDFRDVNNFFGRYGVELRSGFIGMFNFHLGTNWTENKTTTNGATFNSTRNLSFLDFNFNINNNLNLSFQNERYYFKELEPSNNTYYFSDFTVRYAPNNKKFNFMLRGENLFNTKTFQDVFISDIQNSVTSYRLRERTILLSVDFRF